MGEKEIVYGENNIDQSHHINGSSVMTEDGKSTRYS